MSDKALRHDKGKPRVDLIASEFLEELGKVLAMGAEKYAEHNWTNGMKWLRCYASLQRHAQAWEAGNSFDRESGLHHMAHVAINAMFIYIYQLHNIGEDNRWKRPIKENVQQLNEAIERLSSLKSSVKLKDVIQPPGISGAVNDPESLSSAFGSRPSMDSTPSDSTLKPLQDFDAED